MYKVKSKKILEIVRCAMYKDFWLMFWYFAKVLWDSNL